MLPVEALSHGLAKIRERDVPASVDMADAAWMTVDLREYGWTVVATPREGSRGEREAVLAKCIGILAGLTEPTPRMRSDAEALLTYLRSMAFDLAPCEPGAM